MATSNLTTYSDPRFGVEKLLICPLQCSGSLAAGLLTQHYLSEDIILTECGEFITTAVALSAAGYSTCNIQYSSSSAIFGVITVGDTSANGAAGAVVKSTAFSSTTILTAGGYLQFYRDLSGDGTGCGIVYVKYKQAFVTP